MESEHKRVGVITTDGSIWCETHDCWEDAKDYLRQDYKSIEPNMEVTVEPTLKQMELLELMHSIVHATGKEARTNDLAIQLKIKPASVVDHKRLLRKKGFLLGFLYCPYCGGKI